MILKHQAGQVQKVAIEVVYVKTIPITESVVMVHYKHKE